MIHFFMETQRYGFKAHENQFMVPFNQTKLQVKGET